MRKISDICSNTIKILMIRSYIQIIIAAVLVFCASVPLSGQGNVIKGKVTTFETIPLSEVRIEVKSTKKVVFTNSQGIFTLSCSPKDKLLISAEGFYNRKIKVKPSIKHVVVNLKLKPGQENRDIAIGYGHILDADRLHAISVLDEKDLDFSSYSNIYDIVRGRFPGVEVRGAEIIIRGESSITLSNAALLVMDGFVVDEQTFSSISTADVKSINVLKGNAAAVYGSRGANGVVIVETKSGKSE